MNMKTSNNKMTSKDIMEISSKYFNIPIDNFTAQRRENRFSAPRIMAMKACRDFTSESFYKIADAFDRSADTVRTNIRLLQEKIDVCSDSRRRYNSLKSFIENNL